MRRGDFFQIRKSVLSDITDLGMNALVAYLVLARGSSADNYRTTWSTHAIERKTGIGRVSAKNALRKLMQAGFLDLIKAGKRPVYGLSDSPPSTELNGYDNGFDWIWLPNSLVDGIKAEVPPIEKLRRLGSVETLELFIALYDLQNLAEAHGIHWSILRTQYDRSQVIHRYQNTLWGFTRSERHVRITGPISTFLHRVGGDVNVLWRTLDHFETIGLLETSPLIVEGLWEEAGVIMSLDAERYPEVNAELDALNRNMLAGGPTTTPYERYDMAAAISNAYPDAQLVEVYRTRYRAKTSLSAAWVALEADYKILADTLRDDREG